MLEVGNGGMTDAEYRTHFSLWSELAAPLIMGHDVSTQSAATKAILGNADVIAVDQDPKGAQGTVVSDSGGLLVMRKPLANGDLAVTLTNKNSTSSTISTTASALGIGGVANYSLKDLWTKATSSTTGAISATVAGHATVMYRVSPNGTVPPPPPSHAGGLVTDTTTQGSWKGVYGSDGYSITGDAESLPAGISVQNSGTPFTWAASSTDVRALQKASTGRVAAATYGSSLFITVTNSTATAHRISLYLLDWDGGGGRQESVTVTDVLGNVLSGADSGAFANGKYLSWDVSGSVSFTVTSTAGANAVVSGLFFGPAMATTTATASDRVANTAVQGDWKGQFGSKGYSIYGDTSQAASGVDLTTVAGTNYTWNAAPTTAPSLQRGGTGRIAACLFDSSAVQIRANVTDGTSKKVTVYLLDWDGATSGGARQETLTVKDTATGAVLDTYTPGTFAGGTYVSWTVTGDVTITATRTAGTNAVVSAAFID
jgi:hypothetical protein